MSTETSYAVTLKVATDPDGTFQRMRILKGKSGLDDALLTRLNAVLAAAFTPQAEVCASATIGGNAEQQVMHRLLQLSSTNDALQVSDTSSVRGHGDMRVEHGCAAVCVEVKCYTKPVPMKEVEKYAASLKLPDYTCGLLIQMEPCGFARECDIRTPLDMKIISGKPTIFMTAVDLAMLYPAIIMLDRLVSAADLPDAAEIERQRQALVGILERARDVRAMIEQQKKITERMERSMDAITQLAMG